MTLAAVLESSRAVCVWAGISSHYWETPTGSFRNERRMSTKCVSVRTVSWGRITSGC